WHAKLRLKPIYHLLYATLIASSYASRRRALAFDKIPFEVLSKAYAEHLGRLFLQEPDLRLEPSSALLRVFGLKKATLRASEDLSAVSVAAAEAAVERENVVVTAL